MPRKPKVEKQTLTILINGKPVAVILHPPTDARKSWYAYWPGLVTSKSTGCACYQDAVIAVDSMVKSGGKRATVADASLTDEEFEQIQRAHFGRRTEPAARARSAKSLEDCVDAFNAFKLITGLEHIALATADDCARFQSEALELPVKDWSATLPSGQAYVHVFRKTGLQHAHDGEEEETSRKVASDAGVSQAVLLNHYVKPKLWRQSQRTHRRLLASLPAEVAQRYGFAEGPREQLERELSTAQAAGNWSRVAEVAAQLSRVQPGGQPGAVTGL